MKLNRRKALIYGIPLFFVLVLTLFLVFIFATDSPSNKPLLMNAKQFTNTTGQGLYNNWQWVENDRFIFLNETPPNFNLISMDAPSGKKSNITAFQISGGNLESFQNGAVSPNGKWSIWDSASNFSLVSLERNKTFTTPKKMTLQFGVKLRVDNSFAWFPDSKRWLEIYQDKSKKVHLLIHALDETPQQDITLDIDPANGVELLGITTQNEAILIERVSKSGSFPRHLSCDLNSVKGITKNLKYHENSMKYSVIEEQLSPNGKRIAYIGRILPLGFLAKMLISGKTSGGIGTIWTSNLDGSDIKIIGEERFLNGENIISLKWLPDGAHLSFIYYPTSTIKAASDQKICVLPTNE